MSFKVSVCEAPGVSSYNCHRTVFASSCEAAATRSTAPFEPTASTTSAQAGTAIVATNSCAASSPLFSSDTRYSAVRPTTIRAGPATFETITG
jgi:hypothetical protein